MKKLILSATIATSILIASSGFARDYISIAGSSTVLPFASIVAEQLGKNPNFKTPVVESGGSSVGKKGVCDGIGQNYIDIGNASSRMKIGELEFCEGNGVTLTEIKVGYDGIVVANSKKGRQLVISKSDLGKALTAKVPSADGTSMIDNPYKKWNEINPNLPNIAIRVYGPPTTSGTRASYAQEDPSAYGIFGFSYLDQNSDTLQGAVISGTAPTFENIASDNYSVSRALYFYVKHAHLDVIPGMKDYMIEWTKHWGEDGLLSDSGMIPMPLSERDTNLEMMKALPVLNSEMLK